MIRSTSFVDLSPDAPAEEVDGLLAAVAAAGAEVGALSMQAARTAPAVRRGADLMILAAFEDDEGLRAAAGHPAVATEVVPRLERVAAHTETVRYHQSPARVRLPGLTGGIQRTLALRVDPDTPAGALAEFEHILADMHRYIPAIANSSLSRVDETLSPRGQPWTHVWEQEFETIEGLTDEYMGHAYHWAFVDTWFDPQAPNRIVERTLVHVACPLAASILAAAPRTAPA